MIRTVLVILDIEQPGYDVTSWSDEAICEWVEKQIPGPSPYISIPSIQRVKTLAKQKAHEVVREELHELYCDGYDPTDNPFEVARGNPHVLADGMKARHILDALEER